MITTRIEPSASPRLRRGVLVCQALLAASLALGCSNDRDDQERAAAPQPVGSVSSRAGADPFIRWNSAKDLTLSPIEVVGLDRGLLQAISAARLGPEDWQKFFAVYTQPRDKPAGTGRPDQPALLGTYAVAGNTLKFQPRFPLARGVTYRVVFDPAGLPSGVPSAPEREIITDFSLNPAATTAATTIVRVDPTSDEVPENLLKFYVHFSAPMSRGDVYQYIHLTDSSGKPVYRPFLEIGEELWDKSGKRLTVLCDPGRIKKGLVPREELGPILQAGKSYILTIDAAWLDESGNPLRQPFRKEFRAGPADETPIDPKTWKVTLPKAGTRKPLVIAFGEPLDRALIERSIGVADSSGSPRNGEVAVEDHDTRWLFTPEAAWKPGEYQLLVDRTLEDLAGNRVGRRFEVDEFHQVQREVPTEIVTVPLRIEGEAP